MPKEVLPPGARELAKLYRFNIVEAEDGETAADKPKNMRVLIKS